MDFQRPITIKDISEHLETWVSETLNPSNIELSRLSHPAQATATSLVYAKSAKHLQPAIDSKAGCMIAQLNLKDRVLNSSWKKPVILSARPELLVREILQAFSGITTPYKELSKTEVHPTAVVDPSATLGKNITVGPRAYIGPNCKIGDNCYIGLGAVVCKNSQLGSGTTLHPNTYIGHSTVIGSHCEIMPQATVGSEGFGYSQDSKFNHYRIPHGGKVVLGDDVHVGANSCIDRGSLQDTTIGSGTKIDNLVHIAHNITIGENCLITANVTMAGSSTLGSRMMIGGCTAIDGHIKIADDIHLQAMSVVTKSLDKPGVYGGFPAIPTMTFKRNQATFTKLSELRKTVEGLVKNQKKNEPKA